MTAAIIDDRLHQIDIADLRIAPWNARKTFDPIAMSEFSTNLQTQGIQVPLTVRPLPGPVYEIVAGHRRHRAAQALCNMGDNRFEWLPCIVRELSDDQAREIGLVDNLQREDVPALEEADAYAELKQRLGTPAAIAARVGKDVAYVARRLQLVSLAEMPRKALAERLITVDHALLLARLGVDEQDVNLKWALNPNSGIKEHVEETIAQRIKERDRKEVRYSGYWEPQSVLDLKHHIEQHVGRKLSLAPWDLDDFKLLPEAGACSNCPHNTKANDVLFGDLAISDATCEDGLCFESKRAAFVKIQAAKIEGGANGQDVLRISWKTSIAKPRTSKEGGFNLKQTFRYGQWVDAKPKSCEFVRSAVSVDWEEGGYGARKKRKPGEILTVCIEEKCKVHKKGYAAQKGESDPRSGNQNSPEARAAREKREAEAKAENVIRAAAIKQAIAKVDKLSGELLRRVVLCALPGWLGDEDKEMFPGLEKGLKTLKVDSVEFARAAACLLFLTDEGDEIWANDWSRTPFEDTREPLIKLLKDLGYDASKAWEKPAESKAPAKKPAKKAAKKAAKKGGRK